MNTAVIELLAVVSALVPLLVSVVNQQHWSKGAKAAVSIGVAGLAGFATYVQQNGLPADWRDTTTVAVFVVGVVVASQAAYRAIWRPSGVTTGIESATTLRAAPAGVTEPDDAVTDDQEAPLQPATVDGEPAIPVTIPSNRGPDLPPEPTPPA